MVQDKFHINCYKYKTIHLMPNWDDQFDFDDLDDKGKKQQKKNNQKKTKIQNDDFFDQHQTDKKKPILPTINSRNNINPKNTKQDSNSKINPYANKSFGSKDIQEDQYLYQEELANSIAIDNKKKLTGKEISSQKIDQSVSKLSKNKSEIQDEYEQEFIQDNDEPFHQSIKNNQSSTSVNKNPQSKSKDQQKPALPVQKNRIESNTSLKQDDYEEEFENQEYLDDDFQQEPISPQKKQTKKLEPKIPSQQILKPKQVQNQSIRSKVNIKINTLTSQNNKKQKQTPKILALQKPPVPERKKTQQNTKNSNSSNNNKNIQKVESHSVNKPMKRSLSKNSIHSYGNDKSIKASRISQKNDSEYFPNRHMELVTKSFPHTEQKLISLGQAEINKINERMRGMIRKFNDQLNDLINKNMLILKNKSIDRQQSVEDKIRELQIQKKSGETAIEVMQKDFDKLQGREGELKQQEYQLILEKQIEEKKVQIKQVSKQIITIKRQVDNKGKKLFVKQVEQKNAQNIHHLKTILIQTKKDEQKGDERIQKLTSTQEQLEGKLSDMEYHLDELIREAKQKGVTIQNNDVMLKKHEELKIKLQNSKSHNKKAQSLINTKIDILNHENQQVRIMIKNINSQVHNLFGSIQHSQNEAIKLIQKAKEKTGINPIFAENLDKLLKQIEQSRANNDYFDARSEVKSRRSQSTKTKFKNPAEDSSEKSMPLRVAQSQNKMIEIEENATAKPKFNKKKYIQEPKLNVQNYSQLQERVWNQNQLSPNDLLRNNQNRRSLDDIPKRETPLEKKQYLQEEKKEKNQPFILRKNKIAQKTPLETQQKKDQNNDLKIIPEKANQQSSANIAIKEQPKKDDSQSINLAPRMIRFGKKKNQDSSQGNIDLNLIQNPQKAIDLKEQQKMHLITNENKKNQTFKMETSEPIPKTLSQEEKPVFVPKRFNLRNKAEKKDDSYTPSVQKDKTNLSLNEGNQNTQPQKQQIKQEYKPKIDFKNQQYKAPVIKQQVVSKRQPQKLLEQPQIKPRFNLRLRDRVNKNNDEEGYAPNIGLNKSLNDNSNLLSDNKKVDVKPETKTNQVSNNQFITQQSYKPISKQPITNNISNPYVPNNLSLKTPNQTNNVQQNNPNITLKQENIINPISNPYAAKFQSLENDNTNSSEAIKRQKGPLKKNKIASSIPKQNFNIYAQADDISNYVKQAGGTKIATQNVAELPTIKPQATKKEQLNLNQMLGIKKDVKKNDFDDLLGDIEVVNGKNKKKNNDFFSDLQF